MHRGCFCHAVSPVCRRRQARRSCVRRIVASHRRNDGYVLLQQKESLSRLVNFVIVEGIGPGLVSPSHHHAA
ncbi:hypothetical protein GWL_38550 [Herbaspirillum sp. GW103]|nr:hypothetical protein GWL_38550 [Herbaspirillum sp. GW103]